jgi:hypothetical protein
MRNPIIVFVLIILGWHGLASCNSAPASDLIGPYAPDRPMPTEGLDTMQVTFDDVHTWVENGQFYVVGLANNLSNDWQQYWLRLTALDAAGQVLTINGKPDVVVPVMADAVPPRGRSSFFAAIPLDKISGTPADCKLAAAGAKIMDPGPILIATEISGVRVLVQNESDTVQVEKAWQMRIKVTNPLPLEAQNPCLESLLYGRDGKLWYAQTYNPQRDTAIISQSEIGPIPAQGSRIFAYNISYDSLPKGLQDAKIRNVEVLCFDRNFGRKDQED